MCGNDGPGNATHGVCNYATGMCKCNEEWEGNACESPSCFKLSNCSGHGSCNDGNCSCDAGWAGDACSVNTALVCLNNCSSHGECVLGKCNCAYGYRGKACNELKCFHGTLYKKKCNSTKNATAVEDEAHTKIGMKLTCVCDNGWEGIHCNTTADQPSALVNATLEENDAVQAANDQLALMPCPVVVAAPVAGETTRMSLQVALNNFDVKANKKEFEEALKADMAKSLGVLTTKITVNAIMAGSADESAFIELTMEKSTSVTVDISIEGGDAFKVAAFPKDAKFDKLGQTCGQPITPDSIAVTRMPAARVMEDEEVEGAPKQPNLSGLFALLGQNSSQPKPLSNASRANTVEVVDEETEA